MLNLASNATAFLGASAPGAWVATSMKHYARPSLNSVARSTERFLLQNVPNYVRARYNDAFLILYKLKHQLPLKEGRSVAEKINTIYRDAQQALAKSIGQWNEYFRFNKALLSHNQNYLQQLKTYSPSP